MNNRNAIIPKLKKIIVQVIIMAVTLIVAIILSFIDNEITTQLAPTFFGIFIGTLSSLAYVKYENQADEAHKNDLFSKISNISDDTTKNIHTEIEKALNEYSNLTSIGVTDIVKSNAHIEAVMEDIKNAHSIKCLSRTGERFLTTFSESIITAIRKETFIELQIIISTEKAAGAEVLEDICADTRAFDHIKIFYSKCAGFMDSLNDNQRNKVKIREYSKAITGNLLIIDGTKYRFIPYLSGQNSANSIAIFGENKKPENKGIFENLDTTFTYVWNGGKDNKPRELTYELITAKNNEYNS